jgi:hypothetical protein
MEQEWDFFSRNSGTLLTPEDVYKRLRDARAAAKAHRYEEALDGYLWFHENSSDVPGMAGVRLSFALADWIALGRAYPPARSALEALRDRKAKIILKGFRDVAFFRDVVAIDKRLGRERATYELFIELHAASPDLAQNYARLALPAIIHSGDPHLARQFLPVPSVELSRLRSTFDASSGRMRLGVAVEIFVRGLRELLDTFHAIGESTEAGRIRATALESFESLEVRDAVRRELERWE